MWDLPSVLICDDVAKDPSDCLSPLISAKSYFSESRYSVRYFPANIPWPMTDGTAALFVATEFRGNIRRLGGGVKAWPIGDRAVHFNGAARYHSIKHHNQTRFGSVGAESLRKHRSGCVLWRAFFWNYGRRGDFMASLNCDQADELDRSTQSLASQI